MSSKLNINKRDGKNLKQIKAARADARRVMLGVPDDEEKMLRDLVADELLEAVEGNVAMAISVLAYVPRLLSLSNGDIRVATEALNAAARPTAAADRGCIAQTAREGRPHSGRVRDDAGP